MAPRGSCDRSSLGQKKGSLHQALAISLIAVALCTAREDVCEGGACTTLRRCAEILFPLDGHEHGEHDPCHVTVSAAGCEAGALSLWLQGSVEVAGWSLGPGTDQEFVESVHLRQVFWGKNTLSLMLTTSPGNARQQDAVSFHVSTNFLHTTVAAGVLVHDEEWTLNGVPFTLYHASVASKRPSLVVEWPPVGYTFKRMGYGPTAFVPFLRVRAVPSGNYQLAVSVDGGVPQLWGNAYFVSLRLPQGSHTISACLYTPDGVHRISEERFVSFTVDPSQEYVEDGAPSHLPSKGISPDTCARLPAPQPHDAAQGASVVVMHGETSEEKCLGGCGGGQCVHGSCICPPDFVGTSCEHSMLEGTRYLPDEDPVGGGRSRCQADLLAASLAQELVMHLQELQFPDTWDANNITHLSLNETSGFGVTLHVTTQALSLAIREGRSLVMHGKFSYFWHRACKTADLSCYFEPPHGNCPPEVLWDSPPAEYTANYQLSHDWHIPVKFGGPGGGAFFFSAYLSRFLMTPNRRLLALLRKAKRAIGFGHPIMGVHVRHGDSCPKWEDAHSHLPGAKCESFERYLDHMREMKTKYGVSKVFVSSDDQGVIDQLSMHPEFTFVHLDFDRGIFSASDWAIELKLIMATMDRRLVAESTIVDILLLSECDYFVGTLSSHFGALAYELSYADRGYHVPYISLDYPWSGSLLAPVQYYESSSGETVETKEHNPKRKDFTQRTATTIRTRRGRA